MESNNLSIKQEAAIDLIMAGYSDSEVAKEVGITRQTVSRWRNDNPDFIEALQMRRALMREQHMEVFSELIGRAIAVLRDALDNGDERTRLKTAMFILRVSGLQGYAKPAKEMNREEMERATFLSVFEEALTQVHEEKGIKPN